MQVWTLAYHNRTGTGALLFTTEAAAYQALINMVVDPNDSASLTESRKMLFLESIPELCGYLQKNHFGQMDDYRVQEHTLNIVAFIPE